jgi:folylpolyglutamate synthase/dihydropteroate synthase
LLREREPREMLTAVGLDDVAQLVCARPPNPRALAPEAIAEAAVELGFDAAHIEVVDTPAQAVSSALLTTPEDGEIVFTGSLYFVGAVRSILVKE